MLVGAGFHMYETVLTLHQNVGHLVLCQQLRHQWFKQTSGCINCSQSQSPNLIHSKVPIEQCFKLLLFVSAFHAILSIAYARFMDRSCVDSSDWYGTGGYDPDGDGGVGPFSIECDGDYLVFHHSQEALKRVHGYAPNVSAHTPLLTLN